MTLPAAVRSFITGHRRLLAVVVGLAVLAGGGSGIAFVLLRSTTLTVLVKDVPSQSRASVLVSGPSAFSKRIASSRTFTVSPGTYRIEATPESDGSSTVYPTHDSTRVVITSGSSSQVVVDYADIVPATTKVGTAATLKGATVTPSSITVPSSNAGVSSFAVGDVLAFGQTPETPKGLLVKVTTVVSSNGMTTLSVTPAPITAALSRARIDLVAHFSATPATTLAYSQGSSSLSLMSDELGGPMVLTALSATKSVDLSWSPDLPAYVAPAGQSNPLCSGTPTPGVTATVDPTASVDLNVTATISGSWGFLSGPQFSMVLSGSETALAELQANVIGTCSDSVTETLYDLPPVDLQIGPIPLVIVPEVQLEASFKATLSGNVTIGAKQSITLEGGVSYTNGQFHLIHNFSSSASLVGSGSASADLKVSGGPILLMALDDQEAGPDMQVLGDVQARASTSDPSAAGIYAGGTAGVGAEVHFFGINATAGPWGPSWGPIKLWPPKATSSPTSVPKPSPTPPPSLVPGAPQTVSRTAGLAGVACSSATSCEAVGFGPTLTEAVVVPITNGTPGTAQTVSGSGLDSVACPSATSCEAVGGQAGLIAVGQSSEGVVVPVTNGTAGTAQTVSGTGQLDDVACSSATRCVAVGFNYAQTEGVVVPITNGTPGTAQTVSRTAGLAGVACPSATSCVAVGSNSTGTKGVVVLITNGTVGNAQTVSGTSALYSVACTSTTSCEAVGQNSAEDVVVPITNGTPGTAQAVSGTNDGIYSVACSSATSCEAVGENSAKTEGVVVPIINGTPGTAQTVSGSGLSGVACPSPTSCEAVGQNSDGTDGVVVPITSGTPGAT